MVTVIQRCQVSPPPGSVGEKSLPLTYFELITMDVLIQHLFFFELPISKDLFVQTAIPHIKNTLSLTLKHLFPLAGNVIFSRNDTKPEIRHSDGDSMSLIFAESADDFTHLTGNHARNSSDFYSLLPQLPEATLVDDQMVIPIAAIQVTLFPNSGFCLGFRILHAMGDGTATSYAARVWASIFKSGDDKEILEGALPLPSYDRTTLKDPKGLELETVFWNQGKHTKFSGKKSQIPTNKVRATFIMTQPHIQQLKEKVTAKYSSSLHVSAFTVACGYVWSCVAKANVACGEVNVGGDEIQYFRFMANCRAYLNPPLPANYIGNCTAPCIASAKHSELMAEEGFLIAAKSIGETITKRLHGEKGLLESAENWLTEFEASMEGKRAFGVTSWPRFQLYDLDFGVGRLKKIETITIEDMGSFSLGDCMGTEGALEIGLSVPHTKMEAFASFFDKGLFFERLR